jgi:adenosylcobinamide kinase/adenosylcobinamide-phosphate guanylyltransferase
VLEAIEQLLTAARQFTGTIIFVTNEVGDGIVPDNRLAREFRDLAGLVNQRVAQAASEVYLVVCGLPVEIKSRALFPAGGNQ